MGSKLINLKGKMFGSLIVLKRDISKKSNMTYWICECKCGNIKSIRRSGLIGGTKSCGCLVKEVAQKRRIDLLDRTFGYLKVKTIAPKNKWGQRGYICECKCGNVITAFANHLLSGKYVSCGCKKSLPFGSKRTVTSGYVEIKYNGKYNKRKSKNSNWMFEHDLIMCKKLGRALTAKERVHHKNGTKDDNRLSNLELWVVHHPNGKRLMDMLKFCNNFIKEYEEFNYV